MKALAFRRAPNAPDRLDLRRARFGARTGRRFLFEDENIRVFAIAKGHYNFPPGEAARVSRSYAFRIEAGGRSIVFTGDTR